MRVPQRSNATAPSIFISINVMDVEMTHLLNLYVVVCSSYQFCEIVWRVGGYLARKYKIYKWQLLCVAMMAGYYA